MHAVRWARRYLHRMMALDYTKWHATRDANLTLCGCSIPLAINGGTFLPETDDELSRVDCKRCIPILGGE